MDLLIAPLLNSAVEETLDLVDLINSVRGAELLELPKTLTPTVSRASSYRQRESVADVVYYLGPFPAPVVALLTPSTAEPLRECLTSDATLPT